MPVVANSAINGDSMRYYGHLSTLSETVVLVGELTSVPDDTIRYLEYNVISGTEADVRNGMEVEILDGVTGASKGRLRTAGVATLGLIQIGEFSLGRVNIGIGDEMRVYRSYRVHDRLVRNTPQFERDSRTAYVDQNEVFDPIACSGGVYANFVSKASAVGFRGADSRTNDPDSSGSVNHDWTFPSGTPSTSVFANNTVDYSGAAAGTYMVTHEVEDDTNSRTATQYIPVILHDDANPPYECIVDVTGNRDDGDWRATFITFADAITDLPDGALVVFWLDERFGSTNASYGNEIPTRSHIKFVGYLVKETAEWNWEDDTVTFEAISALGVLKQLAGSSQAITAASDPDSWLTMQSPTVNRVIWYLLHWNSTVLLSHDLLLPDDSPLYPAFYVQEADFYNQVRELADAVDCQFVVSRSGRLAVNKPLALADASERSAAVTTITLDADDILDISMTEEHRTQINLVEGRGITEGLTDSAAVFSRAPGNAPAEGTGRAFFERKIVRANPTFQGDLNARTGWSYARVNSLYYGLPVPRGIRVTLRSGYDVFDVAYAEWIVLNVSDPEKGIDFDNTRCTLQEINVNYDPEGERTVVLILDAETDGVAGVAYTPPEVAVPTDPPVFIPPAPPVTPLGRGTQRIAMFTTANELWITANFLSGDPTWTELDLTALSGWSAGTVVDFTVDAYSPRYVGGGTAVNGWLCTTTRIYRITDIFGTVAITSVHTFSGNMDGVIKQMNFERGVRNWGMVTSYENGIGVYVAYTTNGTSFTEVLVNANYDTNAGTSLPTGLYVSPHIAGYALVTAYTSTGTGGALTADVYRTDDYGANWTATSNPNITPGNLLSASIVVPYLNTSGDTVYFVNTDGSVPGYDPLIYKVVGAGTPVSASPTGGYAPVVQRGIATADADANTVVVAAAADYSGGGAYIVARSRDGGASYPDILVAADVANPYRGVYVGDRNLHYLIGNSGAIALVDNFTVYDKKGALSTAGRVVALCGG